MRDILLDADFDLRIENGNVVVGESSAQHKQCLILAAKGDYRQFPWVGVGMARYINDDAFGDAQSEIQKQFELDGLRVERLRVYPDGTIEETSFYS